MIQNVVAKMTNSKPRSLWRFFSQLVKEYNDKGCRQQSAALTYMTLFAIVPLMTVVFTMFSLFPAFEGMSEKLQSFLFQHMIPDSGLEIEGYLTEFTEQARSLTLAGVLMLVMTAYFMIKNIERSFNDIWGVVEARKGLSNFLLYWAVLSLGPLLLGLGLAISTYLLSLRLFVDEYDPLGLVHVMFSLAPWVFTALGFTLLFAAVPNCKVPLRDALAGGVLTAIGFELFKSLFGWVVAHTTFKAVYGAFAIVPLFLIWIYALWMIVLGGAVFVRTLSTFKTAAAGASYTDLIATLLALWKFHLCQKTGEGANDEQLLAVGIETDQWQRVREALLIHHVITVTQQGDYVLCRDLSSITLRDLVDMIGVESQLPGVSDYLQSFKWFPSVASRLLSVDQHIEVAFDVPVMDLFLADDEAAQEYPDEGLGLEGLQRELSSYDEALDANDSALDSTLDSTHDSDLEADTTLVAPVELSEDTPLEVGATGTEADSVAEVSKDVGRA